jgi:hypothetical protein
MLLTVNNKQKAKVQKMRFNGNTILILIRLKEPLSSEFC